LGAGGLITALNALRNLGELKATGPFQGFEEPLGQVKY